MGWVKQNRYWTESDQVMVMRDAAVEPLYALVADGAHLVAPHRLLPFPRSDDFDDPALVHLLRTKGGNEGELRDNDAKRYYDVSSRPGSGLPPPLERSSCCFDPGDCTRRDQWVHFNVKEKDKVWRFLFVL